MNTTPFDRAKAEVQCSESDPRREQRAAQHSKDALRYEIQQAFALPAKSLPPWSSWATFARLSSHPSINGRLLEAARSWTPSVGNLVLLGPTGTGKSACAHGLAFALIGSARERAFASGEQWRRADVGLALRLHWCSASALALARRSAKFGTGEATEVHDAMRASVLFVDELGFEAQAGDAPIFDIVDARYQRGLATIVTSGRSELELVERYGVALMRRLREPGVVVDVRKGVSR